MSLSHAVTVQVAFQGPKDHMQVSTLGLQGGKHYCVNPSHPTVTHLNRQTQPYLPPTASSCGWAPAVFLCERRSDPPGLLLGRLDIGTSLLKGHTLSRHYHSLKDKTEEL